jgi:hypothetical protein
MFKMGEDEHVTGVTAAAGVDRVSVMCINELAPIFLDFNVTSDRRKLAWDGPTKTYLAVPRVMIFLQRG